MAIRARRTTATSRAPGAMLCLTLATGLAACSGSISKKPDDTTPVDPKDPKDKKPTDPNAFTVSYRSQVRVPDYGVIMKQQAFVEQVTRLDPIAAKRCPVSNKAAFQCRVRAAISMTGMVVCSRRWRSIACNSGSPSTSSITMYASPPL